MYDGRDSNAGGFPNITKTKILYVHFISHRGRSAEIDVNLQSVRTLNEPSVRQTKTRRLSTGRGGGERRERHLTAAARLIQIWLKQNGTQYRVVLHMNHMIGGQE